MPLKASLLSVPRRLAPISLRKHGRTTKNIDNILELVDCQLTQHHDPSHDGFFCCSLSTWLHNYMTKIIIYTLCWVVSQLGYKLIGLIRMLEHYTRQKKNGEATKKFGILQCFGIVRNDLASWNKRQIEPPTRNASSFCCAGTRPIVMVNQDGFQLSLYNGMTM